MNPAKLPPDTLRVPGPHDDGNVVDPVADPAYSLREAERTHIRRVLDLFRWNKQHAAKALRISRDTLYRKIADYDLHPSEGRR